MGARRQVAVGVPADEGLPERVITTIAGELPDIFAARVSGQARWRVEHGVDQLPLDEEGDIPMRALSRQRRRDRGWDLLVLVTDLPRRAGTEPVVAGVDVEHGVAMISLPALGAVLVRRRARALPVRVVRQLVSRRLGIARLVVGSPGLRAAHLAATAPACVDAATAIRLQCGGWGRIESSNTSATVRRGDHAGVVVPLRRGVTRPVGSGGPGGGGSQRRWARGGGPRAVGRRRAIRTRGRDGGGADGRRTRTPGPFRRCSRC